MTKTITIVFGVIYALLGVVGFIANPLASATGFFVENMALTVSFLVLGLILLAVGIWAHMAALKIWDIVLGVVLVLVALLGFIVAPNGGTELGLAVNGADNWLNIILGVILLVAGIFERNADTYFRHALQ
jgi:Domain of unknown function (DUF4383)